MAKLWTRSSLARPPSWHENRKPIGAFCGVLRPRFRAARLRTRSKAKPRPKRRHTAWQGYFEVARYTPDTTRSKPCTQAHDAPRGLVKRRSNTPNRRPPSTRNPPRNAKRPPPRRVSPSESLKVGKVRKSKVVSRKSKVESRKVDRESRKPPEKSRKSLVFSKSEVVTNAEMPLRAAVSDSKGHFSSKS